SLAPGVLRFWRDFEAALVDKNRAGEETGLQVYSWYQRTGNYLVFLDAQAMPLIPEVLADKKKVNSLFPWAVKPEAIENFGEVAGALEKALAQLDPLIEKATDDAARERLDSMRRNGWIYLRVLRTQHNHMRALRVMEESPTLAPDSPALKARLLPILADEDANAAATIALLREFPPNTYL